MRTSIQLALPSLLVLIGAAPVALRWAPLDFRAEEGTELTKQFRTQVVFQVEDIVATLNGVDLDPAMMGDIDLDTLTLEASYTLSVSDLYKRVEGGRPLDYTRSYEGLAFTYEDGAGNYEDSSRDEFEDKLVRFVWDAEDESYSREVETAGDAESDAESEDLVALLAEDLDLRAFLPAGDVDEGESWELGPSALLATVLPGLDLEGLREKLAADADLPEEAVDLAQEALRGLLEDTGATVTYRGTREVDGSQLAVLAIEADGVVEVDLLPLFETDLFDEAELEELDIQRLDIELSLALRGELLWDAEAGHAHALDLLGELEGEWSMAFDLEQEGMSFGIEGSVEFSGTLEHTASFE